MLFAERSTASHVPAVDPCAPSLDNVPEGVRELCGELSHSHHPMREREAEHLAMTLFGIGANATRFATEKDDTFHLQSPQGDAYVMKVANPSEPREDLRCQVALLQHIAAYDPTLPVPRVVMTLGDEPIATIRDGVGQTRMVRLMTFLDGTPLDRVDATPSQREAVGAILARLRLATAGFSHEGDARRIAWDVTHLPTLALLLDTVDDKQRRDRLAQGVARFTALQDRFAKLRRQVVHNDFSRSNIVVDPDMPAFVTGVIDFGDAVRTAVAIDVSTAVLNQLPRHFDGDPGADMFSHARDLVRGYLRHADLTDEELRLIPHLAMGRVITRALLTLWRATLVPDNREYILRNTEQGWAQLDWFLENDIDTVSGALLDARPAITSIASIP